MIEPRSLRLLEALPPQCQAEVAQWRSEPHSAEDEVVALRIFTDGSAVLEQAGLGKICAHAGWSVVVFGEVRAAGGDPELIFLGAVWGPVVTDPLAVGWLGAGRPTAPVAECSAVLVALQLCRVAGCRLPTEVRSDCTHALAVADGARVSTELSLARGLRNEAELHRQSAPLRGSWVKGHSGCAANEVADVLAGWGVLGWPSAVQFRDAVGADRRPPAR